jgi:hypothetical protein
MYALTQKFYDWNIYVGMFPKFELSALTEGANIYKFWNYKTLSLHVSALKLDLFSADPCHA